MQLRDQVATTFADSFVYGGHCMSEALHVVHQTGTMIFAFGSLYVAVRLLRLSRNTSRTPELYLGLGIGCSVLGYGFMIASMNLRGGHMMAPSTPLSTLLDFTGYLVHNAGVTATLMFVLNVFRPRQRWAQVLFAIAMLALWGGLAGVATRTRMGGDMIGHPAWFMQYLIIWTYPLWTTVESFRYYSLMRRRSALGLADPLLANRFLLWGTASLMTGCTTWIASIPFALHAQPLLLENWTPGIRVATAGLGLLTIACYALTFFPPERFVAWVRASAGTRNPAAT